jgi:hypothetical protein
MPDNLTDLEDTIQFLIAELRDYCARSIWEADLCTLKTTMLKLSKNCTCDACTHIRKITKNLDKLVRTRNKSAF